MVNGLTAGIKLQEDWSIYNRKLSWSTIFSTIMVQVYFQVKNTVIKQILKSDLKLLVDKSFSLPRDTHCGRKLLE